MAKSLTTKIVYASALVAGSLALVLGSVLYVTQVSPVQQRVEAGLTQEMQVFIDSKIDLKVQSGIIGATMLALQPLTHQALNGNRSELTPIFKGMLQDYAKVTNFRGIFSEVVNTNAQSLLRSWQLDGGIVDRSKDPLIQEVLTKRKAAGYLGFSERGVVVTSATPVVDGERLLGLVTMVQGVGSISRDFTNEVGGAWVMLVDKQYVQQRFGHTKPVDKLAPMSERYVFAHNTWFAPEVMSLAQKVYMPVDGNQHAVYLKDGQVIVDLPAYDETGQVFGRQIFIQDEAVFTHSLVEARNQAWLTLLSVLLGIVILAAILILMINRMVIRPLKGLNQTMLNIEQSGAFGQRVPVTSDDEVGQTARAMNQHLEQVSQAIKQANQSIGAMAKGDLNQRIEGRFVGDLLQLQQGVNQSIDNVSTMIAQISQTMSALDKGQFDVKVNAEQAQGEFAQILHNTGHAMANLNQIIKAINHALTCVSEGDFKVRIELNAAGELAVLKQAVNRSVDTLDNIIDEISTVMKAQSEGDLTRRVQVECGGELLILKQAINQNADHLNQVIYQVVMASNAVSAAAEEVSQGSASLSDSVQQQAASVEQTSATMTEMNAAIKNNADNANSVDGLEHELEKNSKVAGRVMQETISAMGEIQASSHKIVDIVSLIDGIAFQTNLLALNAAVEAARAGDHGRGFAVVAGEVRALAQKSAEAAKEIKTLIEASVDSINQGTRLATESEETLQRMNSSIVEVTRMITEIAASSTEQARGVSEINQAIGLIDQVTQQNAALVEQTSAAAESLKEQAEQLAHSMAFFKTDIKRGVGGNSATPKRLK